VFGNERREQVVHRAGRALEFQLPQKLHAPDVGRREHLLVAQPAGACAVDAFGQEVGGADRTDRQDQDDDRYLRNSHVSMAFVKSEMANDRHRARGGQGRVPSSAMCCSANRKGTAANAGVAIEITTDIRDIPRDFRRGAPLSPPVRPVFARWGAATPRFRPRTDATRSCE
jgi:hypothetical protein